MPGFMLGAIYARSYLIFQLLEMYYYYPHLQKGKLRLREVTQLGRCPITDLNVRDRSRSQASLTPKLGLFPTRPGQANGVDLREGRHLQLTFLGKASKNREGLEWIFES